MKIHYLFLLFAFIIGLSSCEKQDANTTDDEEEFHYELPIIFHVLYKDKTDPLQYVPQSRLVEILDVVNQKYKGTPGNSVDMNLTFTLATTDPDGKALPEPGVEYIEWEESYPIDRDKFMDDDTNMGGKGYVKYIWDPNLYINVMIYNFAPDEKSNNSMTGISYLPYTITGSNSLEGLFETKNAKLKLENLTYPHCSSINSMFINNQTTSTGYDIYDVTYTLAHELGHYLGLRHVFSESENGTCEDTDYCEDTPSYDKAAYDRIYLWAAEGNVPVEEVVEFLVKRESCDGEEFISRNIMDYPVSYSDQFTPDQRKRIRHVLNYSPLIPGPKKGQAATRAAAPEGGLDLPKKVMK